MADEKSTPASPPPAQPQPPRPQGVSPIPAPPTKPLIHPIKRSTDLIITGTVLGVPTLFIAIFGYWLGSHFSAGLGVAILLLVIWGLIVTHLGLIIVHEQEWLCIERFGRFHSAKFRGFRFLLPIADKVKQRGTFEIQEPFKLYTDIPNSELDFTDGSAKVTISARGQIGNPEDVLHKNFDALQEQVALWVYSMKDPKAYVIDVFEGCLRPRMQQESIDMAQINGEHHGEEATEEARPLLAAVGFYPVSKKAIIVADIDIPLIIQEERNLVLKGEKEAAEATARSAGYWQPIKAIMDALSITYEQARDLYQNQRGLETINSTKSNITFVGTDLNGVLKTLNVGSQKPGKDD